MVPHSEHTFYAWLIVIGAVCIVTLIGALIDRFYLNRRLRHKLRQAAETSRKRVKPEEAMTPSRPDYETE